MPKDKPAKSPAQPAPQPAPGRKHEGNVPNTRPPPPPRK